MAAIDRFLPRWDVHEVHSIEVDVLPEQAIEAALAAPAAPDAIVRALFGLRGLSMGGSIEEAFAWMRFEVLERTPTEVVVGAAGTPWRAVAFARSPMRAPAPCGWPPT